MEQKIIEIANSLGIDEIGFTSVLNYSYLSDLLRDRLNKGYSCEFEEQNINKRIDVRNIMPNCKSIIAIAVPYAEGYKKPVVKDKGLLSVVSYGEDYHKKLSSILKSIAEEIKKDISFEYKVCVDTSPLIDREICKNAGIGNYGKNMLLINDKLGSFINIGYLLTDLEILSDGVAENIDICGECDICIESCPNKALQKSGGINSKKCVSYLTQTKDYIPLEYRKNMRNQIYGCDMCQLVCPKNRTNSEKSADNDYRSLVIDLEELMKMSNKKFLSKYKNMSGSWRGKNIWKRNALIAIGNLKLKSMFGLVRDELNNESDMIKIYAAWALTELDRSKSMDILHNFIKYENDKVREEFIKLAGGGL